MRQRGFTIIEVVIVLVVAGLLLAAALPSIGAWLRNSRIRATGESISIGLQQARAEAVRRNQPVGFYLVSDNDAVSMTDSCTLSPSSSGWVVALASPAGQCASSRDTFIATRPPGDAANGLRVSAKDVNDGDATSVTFNGYGQVTGAPAIYCVKLSNATDSSARRLSIAINSGGQVRMCDPAIDDDNDPRKCLPAAVGSPECR